MQATVTSYDGSGAGVVLDDGRRFEVGPAAFTPGTKMPEQTITDPADRAALIDWLEKVTKPR